MAAILADDIFKCIFSNEIDKIPIQMSLKLVPGRPIDNKPALVQVMAWRRTGDNSLPVPVMTQFTDSYMRHWEEGGVNSWHISRILHTVGCLVNVCIFVLYQHQWGLLHWCWLLLCMMKSSNGKIFRVAGPFWGESIGHRWIPLTKANDTEPWCLKLSLSSWRYCNGLVSATMVAVPVNFE